MLKFQNVVMLGVFAVLCLVQLGINRFGIIIGKCVPKEWKKGKWKFMKLGHAEQIGPKQVESQFCSHLKHAKTMDFRKNCLQFICSYLN